MKSIRGQVEQNQKLIEKYKSNVRAIYQVQQKSHEMAKINPDKLMRILQINLNLNVIIDRLGNYLNLQSKIDELEELLKNENNYPKIQQKLEKMYALKLNLRKSKKLSQKMNEI